MFVILRGKAKLKDWCFLGSDPQRVLNSRVEILNSALNALKSQCRQWSAGMMSSV